ncbi:hypothetical protein BLNAU_9109 [Blattamonas nauphoetae]|uniref:Uncharacterized protein n=1 Tax=Blattamonas nauphoetae TaxID=2049346 RepID=A0ABQ9XWT3_9EUKA|nr:hypothetical protein BLNAU_9109 [Blattamonas nauphoetae]
MQNLEIRKREISWTILMKWFAEAAIGVELFRKQHISAPPLVSENFRIDTSDTIFIDPSSIRHEPHVIAGSLTSDMSTISSFVMNIYRTLDQTNRLSLPIDYEDTVFVYSRLMVALLNHFVTSGDLILQNSIPLDHVQTIVDVVAFFLMNDQHLELSNKIILAGVFNKILLEISKHDCVIQTAYLVRCEDDFEFSEQFVEGLNEVKKQHSMEVVRNLFFDWKEWVTMMEMVEKGVISLTDLSFLQSRCFRPTLEVLQVKYQNRANPPRIEEGIRAESSLEELQARLPFRSDSSLHSISSLSTETQLPSQHSSSSSDSQLLSSPQPALPNPHTSRDALIVHPREVLTVLHSLLSKPQLDSFPWNLRPGISPEKDLEIMHADLNTPVSLDERFDPSMFDETDDTKMIQSISRCIQIVATTQSTQCIDNMYSFLSLVIAGLHHTRKVIAAMCFHLFGRIIDFLPALDPRADQFRPLRSAFRDGTQIEQQALLELWRTWLSKRARGAPGRDMHVIDFDFDGFLTADLTDRSFFDQAVSFINQVLCHRSPSMTGQWKSDFILLFEKKHRVMDRLADKPGPWSNQRKSDLSHTLTHITFAEVLSLIHGYDFPSELTELITIDLERSPHWFDRFISPALFLSHTSIAPKHRHSFFPMDLMFERYLRDNPDYFFFKQSDLTICSVRKFLHSPLVGLHSLLVRCFTLHFDELIISRFVNMFIDVMFQRVPFDEFHILYSTFPPPRLLDLLISSSHLVKAEKPLWRGFLFIIWSLCGSVAPFGACSSLAKVFTMLAPFDSNPNEQELSLLRTVGIVVVSLHWLSIPPRFNSPLLYHLPSLAGVQRDVLQTLSSHSGIPSLIAPLTPESFIDSSSHITHDTDSLNRDFAKLIMFVRSVHFPILHYSFIELTYNGHYLKFLLSHTPAIVSVVLEFFHRFVSFSSDAVRMELVRLGLLDHVVFAVTNSSFLDDYEKGITEYYTLTLTEQNPTGTAHTVRITLSPTSDSTLEQWNITMFPTTSSTLKYDTKYKITKIVSSLTAQTSSFTSSMITTPTEPSRLTALRITGYPDSEKTVGFAVEGRMMSRDAIYTVTVNEAGTNILKSFNVTFLSSTTGTGSAVLFSSSTSLIELDYNTRYTVTGVKDSDDKDVLFVSGLSFTTKAEPERLLGVSSSLTFVDDLKTTITLSFNSCALLGQTQYTLTLQSKPQTNEQTHVKKLNVTTEADGTFSTLSVALYPFEDGEGRDTQLEFGTEYSLSSFTKQGVSVFFEAGTTSFCTPSEPSRIERVVSAVLNGDLSQIDITFEGRALVANLGLIKLKDGQNTWTSTSAMTCSSSTECSAQFNTGRIESIEKLLLGKIYSVTTPDPQKYVVNEGITVRVPSPPQIDSVSFDFANSIRTSCIISFHGTALIRPQLSQQLSHLDGRTLSIDSAGSESRICGSEDDPCRSMEVGRRIVREIGITSSTFSIIRNTTLRAHLKIESHEDSAIRAGPSTKPELFVSSPSSALSEGEGMIDVRGGRVWMNQVDVVVEQSPTLIFFRMIDGHLTLESCSIAGLSPSTPEMLNSDDFSCSWDTSAFVLENTTTSITSSTFTKLSTGGIKMTGGELTVETSAFHDNSPALSSFPSARRNIDCSDEGNLTIGSLSGGDGTPTSPSPWISSSNCTLSGLESILHAPFFIPALSSTSTAKFDKKKQTFSIAIQGATLIPCGLLLEVFDISKQEFPLVTPSPNEGSSTQRVPRSGLADLRF